ncbi:MAG: FAD-dependent oxidoreductase, partial [Candidatus Sumerlaeota bacterium]|nr:FAD-dependent oxidoreductase [Candidatus Sumerlaeota bacterium]
MTRRDFMNNVLIGSAGLAAGASLSGLARGTDGGDGQPEIRVKGDKFDQCHALRKGKEWGIPQPSGDLYDCIIIGGGVSGLAAAWKLRQLKHDNILLLEKDDAVGGFARDESSGELVYSIAAAYTAYPDNDELVALYADIGVVTGVDARGNAIIAERYLPQSIADKDYIDGTWYDDAWDSGINNLPFPKNVRNDFRAFRKDLRSWYNYVGADGRDGFAVPTDQSTTDAKVRNLDNLSLQEYIAGNGWDPKVSEFFDPFIRSSMGSTHDRISAWAAISFLSGEFGFGSGGRAQGASTEQDTSTLAQPGGNGYLSRLLADRIGHERLRTNAFVIRAVNAGDEVHVTYLEAEIPTTARARTVIYAAPRYMARHLLPDLAAASRNEGGAFHYAPYIVANVHVSQTPAGA